MLLFRAALFASVALFHLFMIIFAPFAGVLLSWVWQVRRAAMSRGRAAYGPRPWWPSCSAYRPPV